MLATVVEAGARHSGSWDRGWCSHVYELEWTLVLVTAVIGVEAGARRSHWLLLATATIGVKDWCLSQELELRLVPDTAVAGVDPGTRHSGSWSQRLVFVTSVVGVETGVLVTVVEAGVCHRSGGWCSSQELRLVPVTAVVGVFSSS